MPIDPLQILAQDYSEGPGAFATLIYLAILVFVIAGMWKVFAKAGQPGWACIIPIYNIVIMLKIAKRPLWCSRARRWCSTERASAARS